jgi:hypothetical protein
VEYVLNFLIVGVFGCFYEHHRHPWVVDLVKVGCSVVYLHRMIYHFRISFDQLLWYFQHNLYFFRLPIVTKQKFMRIKRFRTFYCWSHWRFCQTSVNVLNIIGFSNFLETDDARFSMCWRFRILTRSSSRKACVYMSNIVGLGDFFRADDACLGVSIVLWFRWRFITV